VSKLARLSQFREELADYALLPSVAVSPAGVVIVLLEFAAGLAAIVPSTRTIACGVAIVLLAAFTSAVLVNIARGRTEIACACFGRSSQRLSWQIPLPFVRHDNVARLFNIPGSPFLLGLKSETAPVDRLGPLLDSLALSG
jgi:hypothetical protein